MPSVHDCKLVEVASRMSYGLPDLHYDAHVCALMDVNLFTSVAISQVCMKQMCCMCRTVRLNRM